MSHIEKVNKELNRIESWRVVVDDLLVVFKKPLTEFQNRVYNERLPGTSHTLVREFDRARGRVRFWSCELDEYKGHVSLSFQWHDKPFSSSTGLDFDRKDVVRMVRRGMRAERIPNPKCWTCAMRESDWRAGFRLGNRAYDPSHDFEIGGVHYRAVWWFCNGCLARERARSDERIDVFPPRRGRPALLARLRGSQEVEVAASEERGNLQRRHRTMRRLLKRQRTFWSSQERRSVHSLGKITAIFKGRPVPAGVQHVLDQFRTWTLEAQQEQRRCEEKLEKCNARDA